MSPTRSCVVVKSKIDVVFVLNIVSHVAADEIISVGNNINLAVELVACFNESFTNSVNFFSSGKFFSSHNSFCF